MSELIYYQRNKDVILNRAKDKEARDKYKNVFKEEKNKKREYGKNRCHNMSEEKKQRLKEYQKIIARLKNLNMIMNKMVF